ncbi:hypothetical protein [Alkaliphilus metalliredigens]|uniref:hypothetical protein n=1 Tax=Alkaliphilus metalliredigens TaxID=208226 RepID=UPI0002F1A21C|nr:hypothetical protein [Alkaliphilus metalliredigens]
MSFTCNNCNGSVSQVKMGGLALGQVSKEVLYRQLGLPTTKNLTGNNVASELSAGIVSGFRIRCPKCGKSNWS